MSQGGADPSRSVTLHFWRERATANMVVFTEEYPRGDRPYVGKLYFAKDALAAWGDPFELVVTVAAREGSGTPTEITTRTLPR